MFLQKFVGSVKYVFAPNLKKRKTQVHYNLLSCQYFTLFFLFVVLVFLMYVFNVFSWFLLTTLPY